MTLIALAFIFAGCWLIYKGYKTKWFNTKDGESLTDYERRIREKNPNDIAKDSFVTLIKKSGGLFGGVVLVFFGLMLLLLASLL